jgi:aminopeptidase YwaD
MNRESRLFKTSLLLGLIIFLFLPHFLLAEGSDTLLPAKTMEAILNHASGEMTLNHIRNISQFHRIQASKGYHRAAEYVLQMAKKYGLDDAKIETYPADGKTYYYMYKSSPGWDAEYGELWLLEPYRERVTSFAEIPVSLCPNSQSTHLRADLVFVGRGTSPEDYEGKEVKNKIVLAYGSAGAVHKEAVFNQGAFGIVSYSSARPLDYPDLVRTGSLRPYESDTGKKATFGFKISHRKGEELRAMLERGEKLVVEAKIRAKTYPSNYENVTAIIPGSDLTEEEILFTAHLCHYRPGSNDNASGSAALLEIARTLNVLISSEEINPPRRTIRFLWVPEMSGSIAFASRYPEKIENMFCGINMDMVAQYLNENNSTYSIHCTPHSLPHFINDVVAHFTEFVGDTNIENLASRYRFRKPIVSSTGSRDAFRYRIAPYVGGSDQWIFNDGALAVPMIFLNAWPDSYYHTNQDRPDKCDPTTLKRGNFIATASAILASSASPEQTIHLAGEVYSRCIDRINRDIKKGFDFMNKSEDGDLHTAYKYAKNLIQQAFMREKKAINSIQDLTPGNAHVIQYISEANSRLDSLKKDYAEGIENHYKILCSQNGMKQESVEITEDELVFRKIIPVRNKSLKGPVGRGYLQEKLGDENLFDRVKIFKRDRRITYEILNFIDGKRNLLEILNAVSAEYEPIPLEEMEEFVELLSQAEVIKLQ